MNNLDEIPYSDYRKYRTMLIPKLYKYAPGKWVKIETMAMNVPYFLNVVKCMAKFRIFDNKTGYCLIELNNTETHIRIEPGALRLKNVEELQWKYL